MIYTLLTIFFYFSSLCALEKINLPNESISAETYVYRNHQYIIFNGTQFVHDPDCPCQSKIKWISYNEKKRIYKLGLTDNPPIMDD